MERTTTLWVWFILMIFLGISIDGGLSQRQQHLIKKTRSSAVVVGTVYCDTCFNSAFSKTPNHLIPGALVAVECIGENSKPSFKQEVKTDERGEFKVKLPFSVSKHVKNIKRCSVKLLKSSQPYCSIASSATSSSLKRLKSSNHGENTSVFSAGFFTFKPENQPEICSQKQINLHESKHLLPQLPPLLPPKLGSLHNKKSDSLDNKKTEVRKPDIFFPPNPLNPPSVIPPNPLIPSIPTPTLPPNPVIPSPPSLPGIPTLPPSLPVPLPPVPAVPGVPALPPVPVVNPPSQPSPSSPIPAVPGIPTLPPALPIPLPPVPAVPGIPPLPPVPVVNPPPKPSLPIPLPPLIPGTPPASPSFSNHHQP